MIRCICDKCGKDITDEVKYKILIQSLICPYTDNINKDICDECKVELLNMLTGGNEE